MLADWFTGTIESPRGRVYRTSMYGRQSNCIRLFHVEAGAIAGAELKDNRAAVRAGIKRYAQLLESLGLNADASNQYRHVGSRCPIQIRFSVFSKSSVSTGPLTNPHPGHPADLTQADTPGFPHFLPTRNEKATRGWRKSLIYILFLVGGAGFEPATPAV